MISSEASGNIQPRSRTGRYKLVKRSVRGYFWAVCILFIAILMLCVNNFMIYESYKDIQRKLEVAIQKFEFTEADKQILNLERESLIAENNLLQEKYDETTKLNEELLKQMEEVKRQGDELMKKNRELIDDNIALQNSLKLAASAGIKPQNYTKFNGLNSRSRFNRGKYIGKFLGTAYTPSKEECGNNKGITNSGKPIIPGISIAIDNRYWPFGTIFYIKGLGYAVAMDTGSAIKGKYRFDFSVFDKNFARALGSRKWDVYLVKLGKGYVEDFEI